MIDRGELITRCYKCGTSLRVSVNISPADSIVEGPPTHWLADSCKPSDPNMERLYTTDKIKVTCLLCKIKCRTAEKQNES